VHVLATRTTIMESEVCAWACVVHLRAVQMISSSLSGLQCALCKKKKLTQHHMMLGKTFRLCTCEYITCKKMQPLVKCYSNRQRSKATECTRRKSTRYVAIARPDSPLKICALLPCYLSLLAGLYKVKKADQQLSTRKGEGHQSRRMVRCKRIPLTVQFQPVLQERFSATKQPECCGQASSVAASAPDPRALYIRPTRAFLRSAVFEWRTPLDTHLSQIL